MSGWILAYDGYDPAEEGLREALCTLGNGYVATRGAAPESAADGVHYPGTYASGCYNRLRDEVAGEVVENESLVNLPNWLVLTFAVDDGDWFDLSAVELLAYRQELDIQRGVLTRWLRFRDPEGRGTAVTQRRFVHMESPHLAGLETTISAENWAGRLRIRSAVDGSVENTGVERYRKLSGRHLQPLAAESYDDTVVLVAETTQSHVRVGVAARTRVARNDTPCEAERRLIREPARIGHELAVHVEPGDQVSVEKVVALFTSRDPAMSEPAWAVVEELRRAGGFDGWVRLSWSDVLVGLR